MGAVESSVRDQIALFVEGYQDAAMLTDRLPDLSDLDEADEPDAVVVVMCAIGHLSEYQAGVRDESDVRHALSDLAGWSIERSTGAAVTPQADLGVQVSAGARTQLLEVHA